MVVKFKKKYESEYEDGWFTGNAKRFSDLTEKEKEASVLDKNNWNGDELFLERVGENSAWIYVWDEEVDIITE